MIGPICLAVPLLFGAAQDDLKAYTSKEGRFSANMPGAPVETTKQVNSDFQVTTVIAEGRHDSYFVVSFSDLPEKELKKGPIEKRLEHACKGAVEKSGGKLRGDEKPIKLDGKHPGREIVIEKNGEIIAKMRIFLVDRRLYQVMVLGTGPIFAPKEKDVGSFLDSFRLNK